MTLPCLNIVGRKSSIFPWEGCEVVGKLIRCWASPTKGICHSVGGGLVRDKWLQLLALAAILSAWKSGITWALLHSGCMSKWCSERNSKLPWIPHFVSQVYFEEANHWLYIEESDKFNSLLLDFLREGFFGVRNKVRL